MPVVCDEASLQARLPAPFFLWHLRRGEEVLPAPVPVHEPAVRHVRGARATSGAAAATDGGAAAADVRSTRQEVQGARQVGALDRKEDPPPLVPRQDAQDFRLGFVKCFLRRHAAHLLLRRVRVFEELRPAAMPVQQSAVRHLRGQHASSVASPADAEPFGDECAEPRGGREQVGPGSAQHPAVHALRHADARLELYVGGGGRQMCSDLPDSSYLPSERSRRESVLRWLHRAFDREPEKLGRRHPGMVWGGARLELRHLEERRRRRRALHAARVEVHEGAGLRHERQLRQQILGV
mmetsp:Transcript_78448/g.217863  ORF Transcript_78448/g.217863 Transcript_78448/m.217863 type:complete len:295 (-) Transcript_78448:173-1057(-)